MKENARLENYRNGPLPIHLKTRAYFTSDKAEFALRKDDALAYLDWCQTVGLAVLGFEIWLATIPGPTVQIGRGAEGDARRCHEIISHIDVASERERAGLNADIVFNFTVDN